MPNFNRTGPRGAGPMTGRAMGLCAGKPGGGLGGGRGRGWGQRLRFWRRGGRGRGFSARFLEDEWGPDELPPELSPDEQRSYLKGERNRLKAQLAETEARLRELGRKSEDEPEA